jgi:drug/metabolite transporter (DMT)-like permease
VSAAAFSHWILDLIVHTPDLPLYDNSDKVGFGLWRHVTISFPLEIAVLLAGTWYFARRSPPADQRGHWALRIFTVVLIALQAYANFGPPPSSETAMAVMALGLYVVLAALAAGLEHIRKTR